MELNFDSLNNLSPQQRLELEARLIGEDYYVSFGNNEAHRCKLVDIPEMYQGQRIKIETPTPRGSITHILFADEIGTTPDEAVMNQVTM
jgi:hypothetical protein